jgi:hypothetical protein
MFPSVNPGPWAPGRRRALAVALAGATLLAGGCATLFPPPLNVTLVGVEPLAGEGLELRLLVKLRLQNPRETELAYDGVALELDLRGRRVGSGVLAQAGTLPRFGETLLAVPVSVSGLAVAREAVALLRPGAEPQRIEFAARGRLGGSAFGTHRFAARAEVDWPPRPAGTSAAPRP